MIVKNHVEDCITLVQMNLIFNTRIFWREFATWTRAYFRSRYLGLGNSDEVFQHLYNVPVKFGEGLNLIFGNQLAQGYTYLLHQHVIILRDLISVHIAGDLDAINRYAELLHQNGNERAKFLAQNPFLDETELKNLIHLYIQYTIEEANTFATRDFSSSIELYDRLTAHTDTMGDYFSQGAFNYIIYIPQNNNLSRIIKESKNNMTQNQCITYSQMNLMYSLRMLWYELTVWTRAYFISVYEEQSINSENVLARLNEIPRDYAAILNPFFGGRATEKNIRLIYEYIGLLSALAKAQKERNNEATSQLTQQIYQNLSQRGNLLASIDPYFNQTEWLNMQINYARYTIEEATAFLSQDHSRSLDIHDRLLSLSLDIGDFFANELYLYISKKHEESNL